MGFLIHIANFEAFRWNISLSANLLFLKSDRFRGKIGEIGHALMWRRLGTRLLLKEEDQFFFLPLLDQNLASLVMHSRLISYKKKCNFGKPHTHCLPQRLISTYIMKFFQWAGPPRVHSSVEQRKNFKNFYFSLLT